MSNVVEKTAKWKKSENHTLTLTFNFSDPGYDRKLKLDSFEFDGYVLFKFKRILNLVKPSLRCSSSKSYDFQFFSFCSFFDELKNYSAFDNSHCFLNQNELYGQLNFCYWAYHLPEAMLQIQNDENVIFVCSFVIVCCLLTN